MKLYYVYILKCSDNSFYTGFSSNLDNRIMQHEMGYYRDCYTFKRRPIELVFYEAFTEPNQAIYFEKKIKGWSKLKKEALISGDFDRLPLLAECKNETTHKNHKKSFDSAKPDKEY